MKQRKDTILLTKIAIAVKDLREAINKSQAEVFDDTGIHIGRIETGKSNCSITTISNLCKYFDVSLSEFFKKIEGS